MDDKSDNEDWHAVPAKPLGRNKAHTRAQNDSAKP